MSEGPDEKSTTVTGTDRPSLTDADREAVADGLFFIIGAPRSGTTLLQAILASHSAITIPPETEFFMKHEPPPHGDRDAAAWEAWLADYFQAQGWTDQGLSEERFRIETEATNRSPRAVFLTLLAMQRQRAGKRRVGEKSPHHCRHVEHLAILFPGAKFIHIHRDPRDVVASQLQLPWTRGSHLHRARAWVRLMRDHERLRGVMPEERYTTVRFETLLQSPDAETRQLCAFLGETFEEGMMRFHERADDGFADREAKWKARTRQPLSQDAAGSYRNRLTPRQIAGVHRVVGSRLEQYGYEADPIDASPLWRLLDAGDRLRDRLDRFRRSLRKRLPAGGDSSTGTTPS